MRVRIWLHNLFFVLFCGILLMQVSPYVHSRLKILQLSSSGLMDEWSRLMYSRFGRYKIIDYINSRTPEDSLILVFRQNDFALYGKRKFIRHLDPRLVPVYQLDDPLDVAKELHGMGIDYIFLPSYYVPTFTDTAIYRLVSNPDLCRLEAEYEGAKLYRLLRPSSAIKRKGRIVLTAAELKWSIFADDGSRRRVEAGKEGGDEVRIIPKGLLTYVITGGGFPAYMAFGSGEALQLQPGFYRLNVSVEGRGWLSISLLQLTKSRGVFGRKLWESALIGGRRDIAVQFPVVDGALEEKIEFMVATEEPFTISGLTIERFDEPPLVPLRPFDVWTAVGAKRVPGSDAAGAVTVTGHSGMNWAVYSGDGHWSVAPAFYSPFQISRPEASFKAVEVSWPMSGVGEMQLHAILYGGLEQPLDKVLLDTVSINSETTQIMRYIMLLPRPYSAVRILMTPRKVSFLRALLRKLRLLLVGGPVFDYSVSAYDNWKLTLGQVTVKEIPQWSIRGDLKNCLSDYADSSARWWSKVVVCREPVGLPEEH